MSNLRQNGQLRWAPSYLRNQGQLTRGQKRAFREHWDRYGLVFQHGESLPIAATFPDFSQRQLVVEIGFGMGDHLVDMATRHPDACFLGIEVHRPGLAAACGKLADKGLENVRLIRGDARLILSDYFGQVKAHAVLIQFPDPWPKLGDEHRRLVQPGLIDVFEERLHAGGHWVLATDVIDYADHSRRIMGERRESWQELSTSPWTEGRSVTPYEGKGLAAKREITDLAWCYQPCEAR